MSISLHGGSFGGGGKFELKDSAKGSGRAKQAIAKNEAISVEALKGITRTTVQSPGTIDTGGNRLFFPLGNGKLLMFYAAGLRGCVQFASVSGPAATLTFEPVMTYSPLIYVSSVEAIQLNETDFLLSMSSSNGHQSIIVRVDSNTNSITFVGQPLTTPYAYRKLLRHPSGNIIGIRKNSTNSTSSWNLYWIQIQNDVLSESSAGGSMQYNTKDFIISSKGNLLGVVPGSSLAIQSFEVNTSAKTITYKTNSILFNFSFLGATIRELTPGLFICFGNANSNQPNVTLFLDSNEADHQFVNRRNENNFKVGSVNNYLNFHDEYGSPSYEETLFGKAMLVLSYGTDYNATPYLVKNYVVFSGKTILRIGSYSEQQRNDLAGTNSGRNFGQTVMEVDGEKIVMLFCVTRTGGLEMYTERVALEVSPYNSSLTGGFDGVSAQKINVGETKEIQII